jgi:hypothetical protein
MVGQSVDRRIKSVEHCILSHTWNLSPLQGEVLVRVIHRDHAFVLAPVERVSQQLHTYIKIAGDADEKGNRQRYDTRVLENHARNSDARIIRLGSQAEHHQAHLAFRGCRVGPTQEDPDYDIIRCNSDCRTVGLWISAVRRGYNTTEVAMAWWYRDVRSRSEDSSVGHRSRPESLMVHSR